MGGVKVYFVLYVKTFEIIRPKSNSLACVTKYLYRCNYIHNCQNPFIQARVTKKLVLKIKDNCFLSAPVRVKNGVCGCCFFKNTLWILKTILNLTLPQVTMAILFYK